MKKNSNINIRITEEEKEKIEKICSEKNLTKSQLMRLIINAITREE